MKRFIIALLTVACTEPTRIPPDIGPREDVGPKDAGDAGDAGPDSGPGDTGPEDLGVIPTGICEDRPCLTAVSNDVEWSFVSGPARSPSRCELLRETHFVIPKETGTAIAESIYIDAEAYENIYFFLREHLRAELPDLDPSSYYMLFERGDMRTYWTGRIFRSEDGSFAFEVTSDFYWGEPPEVAAVEQIRTTLRETFGFDLAYAPQDLGAITRAEQFQNPPFEVLLPAPCAGEGCADPNALCVVIPDSVEICGHFSEGRDVPGELAAKARLQTIAGSYEIPRQVGTTPMRWISGGELGIDRVPIDASTEGVVTVENINGFMSYVYSQRLTAGSDVIDIYWTLNSGLDSMVFREPFLSESYGLFSTLNGTEQINGGSCTATGMNRFFAEGELAGGDVFRISYRHQIPFAGSGPLFVTGAEVILGGTTATVSDYFQLVYAGEHHNWNNQFVVIFDEPVMYMGHEVFGIWIDEPGIQCCPVDAIHTLDASYQKLDQLSVESYVRSPVLF